MRHLFIIATFLLTGLTLSGQKLLLESPLVLEEVKSCLSNTYNFKFASAEKNIKEIEKYTTDHPVVSFLEAFIIYWKNYPIVPGHEAEPEFLAAIELCIEISEKWVSEDPDELEAIYFDLISRAFFVMYWADNGKPGKVFPHLNTLYTHAMEGFELKDEFNEFYFITGLYNYYVEAYPEKHAAYKPVVMFFRDGDKARGLKELEYCAENAIFMKVEARFFLSLIYMNYERNSLIATRHAAELYREFPENIYYTGKYLEFLLYDKKFFFVPVILEKLKKRDNPFAWMQYQLYSAACEEKAEKNLTEARKGYLEALQLAEQFGSFANTYNAIAHMGLGRIYEKEGELSLAKKHFRRAKNLSSYEYIIQDR